MKKLKSAVPLSKSADAEIETLSVGHGVFINLFMIWHSVFCGSQRIFFSIFLKFSSFWL